MTPSITSDGGQTRCREDQQSRKTHTAMNQLAEILERATFVVQDRDPELCTVATKKARAEMTVGRVLFDRDPAALSRDQAMTRNDCGTRDLAWDGACLPGESIEAFESGSIVLESFPFSGDLLCLLRRPVNWKNTRRSN
ncbi:hypothetical protein TIFTF001_009899 [Ficus carica]|uniref:Uncharacterized protein n=1 Tax=Ficus carica TaxID=3494 RepID=A0AA88DHK7_FICCA|nr:hypothetical protein TIFTF001_009899 [Ficus carica]